MKHSIMSVIPTPESVAAYARYRAQRERSGNTGCCAFCGREHPPRWYENHHGSSSAYCSHTCRENARPKDKA